MRLRYCPPCQSTVICFQYETITANCPTMFFIEKMDSIQVAGFISVDNSPISFCFVNVTAKMEKSDIEKEKKL